MPPDLVLPLSFYEKDAVTAARLLLGKHLVHVTPEGTTSGVIVETEAYSEFDDPACHAFRKKTKRNAVMFGPPGRAYVYFIYGNYYCFNVVTNREGVAEAVLVRAVEPVKGLGLMKRRRGSSVDSIYNLTNGPGKLCMAMNIGRDENGLILADSPLYIAEGQSIDEKIICESRRIGISRGQDKLWRFFIQGNPFVSRPR